MTEEAPVPMPPAKANRKMVMGKAKPIAASASVPTIPSNAASTNRTPFIDADPKVM